MDSLVIQTADDFLIESISNVLKDNPLGDRNCLGVSIQAILSAFFSSEQLKSIFDQIKHNEQAVLSNDRFKVTVHQLLTNQKAQYTFLIHSILPVLNGSNNIEKDYLTNVVRFSPGFMYLKDTHFCYLMCNKNFAEAAGLRHPDEIIGKTDYDLAWGDTEAKLFRQGDIEVLSGVEKINFEEPQLQADGQTRTVLANKVPLRDRSEKIIGILGNYVDITDRKSAEQELLEAKEQAEIANRSKTEFIRNMEHDIRTPFSGLLGISDVLFEQEKDVQKKDLLGIVRQSAKELLCYMDDILDYSRTELGMIPIQLKKIDLKQLLERMVAIEKPAALQKGLILEAKYDEALPSVLLGDQHRLERILINIMSNAIKFTNKGCVSLSVKLLKEIKHRHLLVRFIIKDTGIGIPQDKISYIYEKFTRLTPASQGVYRGTGLGLRVVKQFVNDLEGELEVDSVEGKGTTFYCTLMMKAPLTDDLIDSD